MLVQLPRRLDVPLRTDGASRGVRREIDPSASYGSSTTSSVRPSECDTPDSSRPPQSRSSRRLGRDATDGSDSCIGNWSSTQLTSLSTGAQTAEGIARIRRARLTHGRYPKEGIAKRAEARVDSGAEMKRVVRAVVGRRSDPVHPDAPDVSDAGCLPEGVATQRAGTPAITE
jgi:hypothetical protein